MNHRRQEISMSGYYHDLTERGYSVRRGWSQDPLDQPANRPDENELVYELTRISEAAGIISFTPLERTSTSHEAGYLFSERLQGEYARDRSLARRFGQAALQDFELWQGYDGDLGLEVGRDDIDSIRTYYELGFEPAKPPKVGEDSVSMLRPGILTRRSRHARRPDTAR